MSEEEEIVIVHRRITERWKVSARANGAKAKAVVQSEEHKAKLRVAQAARREREKAERVAMGQLEQVGTEKRKPGRPKKEETGTAIDAPKRPVGRPKKQAPTITEETPE